MTDSERQAMHHADARKIIDAARARRQACARFNTALIVLTFLVIVGMALINYRAMLSVKAARRDRDAAVVERDHAREVAAAWKQKDDANYPLARQWRIAYEELVKRGCK